MKKVSLVFIIGLLLLGVGIVCWAKLSQGEHAPWTELSERLPKEIDGWVSEDVPLGATESVLEAVSRLNYSDYIYRKYSKDGVDVYVYAMFWRQGEISIREMAGHTPDACWVSNGATRIGPMSEAILVCQDKTTKQAQVREFQFPHAGATMHVAWWHVWGDDIVPNDFRKKSPLTMVREIWYWLGHRGGEQQDQIFIRIHSDQALETIQETPVVAEFVKLFPQIIPSDPAGGDV